VADDQMRGGFVDPPDDGDAQTTASLPEDDLGEQEPGADGREEEPTLDRDGIPTLPADLEDLDEETLRDYYHDVAEFGSVEGLRGGTFFRRGFNRGMQTLAAQRREMLAQAVTGNPVEAEQPAYQPVPQPGFRGPGAQQPQGIPPGQEYPAGYGEELDPVVAQAVAPLRAENEQLRARLASVEQGQYALLADQVENAIATSEAEATRLYPDLMNDRTVQESLIPYMRRTGETNVVQALRSVYYAETARMDASRERRAAQARASRTNAPPNANVGVRGEKAFRPSKDPRVRDIQMAQMVHDELPEAARPEVPGELRESEERRPRRSKGRRR